MDAEIDCRCGKMRSREGENSCVPSRKRSLGLKLQIDLTSRRSLCDTAIELINRSLDHMVHRAGHSIVLHTAALELEIM